MTDFMPDNVKAFKLRNRHDSLEVRREEERRRAQPPQRWSANCATPRCVWHSGWGRPVDIQTKAYAHAAANKHTVELFAEVFCGTERGDGNFDPRREGS